MCWLYHSGQHYGFPACLIDEDMVARKEANMADNSRISADNKYLSTKTRKKALKNKNVLSRLEDVKA